MVRELSEYLKEIKILISSVRLSEFELTWVIAIGTYGSQNSVEMVSGMFVIYLNEKMKKKASVLSTGRKESDITILNILRQHALMFIVQFKHNLFSVAFGNSGLSREGVLSKEVTSQKRWSLKSGDHSGQVAY